MVALHGRMGDGVIWIGDPLDPPVIPAKAGIQPTTAHVRRYVE